MNQKKLKFLVDVGVSKQVEKWLFQNDYDLKAVRNINPRMNDNEILRLAVSEKRMVITMDKDFGELVYNSDLPHAGVLLLRLEDAKSDEKTNTIAKILTKFSDRLLNNFCVIQRGKLRIKKMKKQCRLDKI